MASSIQLNAGAAYARFSAAPARFVILLNTTGVSLDYRKGSTEYTIASGAERLIQLTASTAELEVRRTDETAIPVQARILYGFEDEGDIERMHAYARAYTDAAVAAVEVGGSGSGVSVTIASLADLAEVATAEIEPGAAGSILSWILAADGSFQVWQLRASTAATGEGVQRPTDYAGTSNEKVWFKCN